MCQGYQQFGIGRFAEFVGLDIPELLINHVGGIDAFYRDVSTYDGKLQNIFFSLTEDTQFDFASFFTFQPFHGFVVGYYLTDKSGIIDRDDTVTGHQADFFRGTSLDDTVDVDGIILDGKLDTDTAEAAFQICADFFHIFGGDIRGMRIQFR